MQDYDLIKQKLKKSILYCFTPDKFAGTRDVIDIVVAQIKGGADIIQLREKKLCDREKLNLALRLREITLKHDVLLIINDDVDIAYFSGADGVHLGQNDIAPQYARQLLKHRIIGVSTHNVEQFKTAQNLDVDYVAIGPIFTTQSKEKPEPVIGINNLKNILKYKSKKVVGIGGIKYEHLEDVIRTGIDCVAVITGIIESANIEETTRKFKEKLKHLLQS